MGWTRSYASSPKFFLFAEYIHDVQALCLFSFSRQTRDATLVIAESELDYKLTFIHISIVCGKSSSAGELMPKNRRVQNYVYHRHLPRSRVLQESY